MNNIFRWKSTIVSEGDRDKFTNYMKHSFGARIQFLEEYKTTSGRGDAIFSVHEDDVETFEEKAQPYGSDITTLFVAMEMEPEEYNERLKEYLS